jgi:hypothetical protein
MSTNEERVVQTVRDHADDYVWLLYYTLAKVRDMDDEYWGEGAREALRVVAAEVERIEEDQRAANRAALDEIQKRAKEAST